MAGKARVHELAKELHVTSKEILARLAEQGAFAKSASSTVEAPVARRLRESYSVTHPVAKKPKTKLPAPGKDRKQLKSAAQKELLRRPPRQPVNPAVIAEGYWRAKTSASQKLINRFFRECEAKYGLSRSEVLKMFTDEQRRDPTKYARSTKSRKPLPSAGRQAAPVPRTPSPAGNPPRAAARDRVANSTVAEPAAVTARPRVRSAGLPQVVAATHMEGVANIVMAAAGSSGDRTQVATRLRELTPNSVDGYGYLTWRYSSVLSARQGRAGSATAHSDLAILAEIVDNEKQLLESVIHAHGPILLEPGRAILALESEFQRLIEDDDIGRSGDDELRRVRNQFGFLRRSLMLTIASRDNGQRLWRMLDCVRPPARNHLVETTPQLERAIARLNERIPSVERLLSTDERSLESFFHRAHADLVGLHAEGYDFLLKFRETSHVPTTQTYELPFAVLPQGEVRAFLDNMRSSGRYGGHYVDINRVTVLEELLSHFGAERCVWHKGSPSSDGIDNRYLILAIKSADGSGEHGVAVSPLAGQHATYVVRHGHAEADWRTLFSHPKFEARLRGARKLLFVSGNHVDQYTAMRDKIIHLLECDPLEFNKPQQGQRSGR